LLAEEYLTINELAARLKVKPKTIKNKMALGIFKRGIHYFSPRGIRPRFKWSVVQAWIEEKETQGTGHNTAGIPMARGYIMGGSKSVGRR
jgi:hypothetical protein